MHQKDSCFDYFSLSIDCLILMKFYIFAEHLMLSTFPSHTYCATYWQHHVNIISSLFIDVKFSEVPCKKQDNSGAFQPVALMTACFSSVIFSL